MHITISIPDPMLRDYVRHKFNKNADNEPIAGHGTLSGIVICSSISTCDLPKPSLPPSVANVTFAVANSKDNQHLRGHHLYVPDCRQKTILKAIEKEFDSDFFFFIAKSVRTGYKIKESIEMFISEYELDSVAAVFDNLKKKEYRDRNYADRNYRAMLKKAYWRTFTVKSSANT